MADEVTLIQVHLISIVTLVMTCEAGHGQFVTRESDKWHIRNPIAAVYSWFKPLHRQRLILTLQRKAMPQSFDSTDAQISNEIEVFPGIHERRQFIRGSLSVAAALLA